VKKLFIFCTATVFITRRMYAITACVCSNHAFATVMMTVSMINYTTSLPSDARQFTHVFPRPNSSVVLKRSTLVDTVNHCLLELNKPPCVIAMILYDPVSFSFKID